MNPKNEVQRDFLYLSFLSVPVAYRVRSNAEPDFSADLLASPAHMLRQNHLSTLSQASDWLKAQTKPMTIGWQPHRTMHFLRI